MKYFTLTSAYIFAILVSLTICFGQTQAEENQTSSDRKDKALITFIEPDFSGEAPEGHRRGLASRSCGYTKENIAINPLIPADSRGLTSKQSPVVWLSVVYDQNISTQNRREIIAELSVEDVKTNKKVVKNVPVKLPTTSGNLQIEIPSNLEADNWYRWYLVLPFDCNTDGTNETSNISVEGLIKRVDVLEDSSAIKQQSAELVKIYAQKGLWYDALDQAAQLKCQNPSVPEPWNNLLTQAQFDSKELQKINLFSRCYKHDSLTAQK